ncbi:hypothetical protein N7448_010734 [Penicillium atrosanguineum]|uniref:Uncharacterized protein n=1 Tax=Penicillium atrosanguineum TaxID=1132637 RepID=A0A9W9KUM4_9EURO|nr:uncharacterized protein N7443_007956 [Penicillium atrosanguineum]KAJ5119025.1 hypothetical protein N7526_010662 [Penicillium atrosanguineum]KAJ5120065.1 hypothetical protein N7448_010734 [Penicillium atrosanguineum]KAJ5297063.1 hypothetical protein N7443_007956 [Penicillium atrosanguineum]KAJ5299822.1 hypothetical protein N7476_011379 [Penicillium atrosanguineum]
MSLSMGSGRECWENSPRMDLRDPYSRDPQRSVEREAERSSDRRETRPEDVVYSEAQAVLNDSEFGRVDPTGWYPHYKNCVQYFVEQGQHIPTVQSVAAFINIRLPCQRPQDMLAQGQSAASFVSLRPYVRRLIITAQDSSLVMRAFFGDDWAAGVGCIYKQERANYLFTAKSSGWGATKTAYDILPDEQAPFLRPLREPTEDEIRAAEARWSEWLAMEDWMVGARSPW